MEKIITENSKYYSCDYNIKGKITKVYRLRDIYRTNSDWQSDELVDYENIHSNQWELVCELKKNGVKEIIKVKNKIVAEIKGDI